MADDYCCYACGRPLGIPKYVITFTVRPDDGTLYNDSHDFFFCPSCFEKKYAKILKSGTEMGCTN